MLELRKIFNTDLKGLVDAKASDNKLRFLSFSSPELSVTFNLEEISMKVFLEQKHPATNKDLPKLSVKPN